MTTSPLLLDPLHALMSEPACQRDRFWRAGEDERAQRRLAPPGPARTRGLQQERWDQKIIAKPKRSNPLNQERVKAFYKRAWKSWFPTLTATQAPLHRSQESISSQLLAAFTVTYPFCLTTTSAVARLRDTQRRLPQQGRDKHSRSTLRATSPRFRRRVRRSLRADSS